MKKGVNEGVVKFFIGTIALTSVAFIKPPAYIMAVSQNASQPASAVNASQSADAPKWKKVSNIGELGVSSSYIRLDFAKKGDYAIYRKEGSDKYVRIATVKDASSYKDTTVDTGTIYKYKFRSFKDENGKRNFGAYSPVWKVRASNKVGKFKVKAISIDSKTKSYFTCAVKNTVNNANIIIKPENSYAKYFDSYAQGKEKYLYSNKGKVTALKVQYSTKGKDYKDIPKEGLKIKAGETFYFKFSSENGNAFYATKDALRKGLVVFDGEASYKLQGGGIDTVLSLQLDTKLGYATF